MIGVNKSTILFIKNHTSSKRKSEDQEYVSITTSARNDAV